LRGVRALEPELGVAERRRPIPWGDRAAGASLGLEHRLTLVSQTPRGFVLHSDVTTSASEAYRPGAVQRLTSVLVRTARRVGEDLVFESSGEALWSAVRDRLHAVLLTLWHEGALAGKDSREAFEVVCDRSIMTQNDIDSGRVICSVSFQPAAPIERITVVLALSGATVSVTSGGLS
jgi:phage tail sheath protein FI